jgi:hypothetical protein
MHRAKRAEAGLTEEVGRRWGGGKRPARRRSGGGHLRWGGDILRGGPAARGRGETGDCGRDVGAEKKGEPGKVERRVEGLEEGGGLPPVGDSSGDAARTAAARPRRPRAARVSAHWWAVPGR